jgi:hypothetical protein
LLVLYANAKFYIVIVDEAKIPVFPGWKSVRNQEMLIVDG